MESARVRDFHTSWCSIWNRTSERSERVRFLILHRRVWKSRTKRFPCCNLFISYILRFSQPQIYILGLDKFELRTTRVHRKYYLVKAARQRYPRWPRKSPWKHNSLKSWFVIGRSDFFHDVWETRFASLIGRSKIRNAFSHSKIRCENLSMYEIKYNLPSDQINVFFSIVRAQ